MKLPIILLSMPMLFAAHRSNHWYMSSGYGQMFSMKKTLNDNNYYISHAPRIFEMDFMHDTGFGFVYMAGNNPDGIMSFDQNYNVGPSENGTYKFKGYFVAYEKTFSSGVTGRYIIGSSNQSFEGESKNGHLATGVSLNYHFDFTKQFCAFLEAGYLKQKEFQGSNFKINISAPYLKIGFSKALG